MTAAGTQHGAVAGLRALARRYPDARCELAFTNPLELLVATVLSAQSTDRRVNTVTPRLFAACPDAASYAVSDPGLIEEIIRPTGMFRQKAQHLRSIGQLLCERFDGAVPASMAELIGLPGVGRKTAIVVLAEAFGVPGISVDTHVARVSRRLGWTSQTKPEAIERDLAGAWPRSWWIRGSHLVIWHGRRCCHARRPACGACPVAKVCPSVGTGPTDATIARALITESGPK